jgi:tRNA (cmo5U34)-methyltransferase
MQIPSEGSWSFDANGIADAFDAHVREQLPWYDLATDALVHIARHYIPEGGIAYDIGASTGNVGRAIEGILEDRSAKLIAVEKSEEMSKRYNGPGDLIVADANEIEFEPFDFGVVFLAAIFMPVTKRKILLDNMTRRLRDGGAIVLVERMEAGTGYPSTISARLTLANKLKSGASADDIISKELSLSGVQRPMSQGEIPDNAVEFFRLGDFAGWIIQG